MGVGEGVGGWPAGERADVPLMMSLVRSLSLWCPRLAAAVAAFVAVVAEELRCCEVLRGAWNDPGLIVAGFALATFAGLPLLSSTAEGRGKQASANTCMQIDDRELHFHEQLA